MSDEEEPAPSAPGSEIGNEIMILDFLRGTSLVSKTALTKCDDKYTVSKRREALCKILSVGFWS